MPFRPNRDDGNWYIQLFGNKFDVSACISGEGVIAFGIGGISIPTWYLFVDGFTFGENFEAAWKFHKRLRAVFIGYADIDNIEFIQHIKFG